MGRKSTKKRYQTQAIKLSSIGYNNGRGKECETLTSTHVNHNGSEVLGIVIIKNFKYDTNMYVLQELRYHSVILHHIGMGLETGDQQKAINWFFLTEDLKIYQIEIRYINSWQAGNH